MCVPGIITAYSHSRVFSTSSGSEVSATWPVMPSPMRVRGKSTRSPLRESSSPRKAIGTTSSPSITETRQLW